MYRSKTRRFDSIIVSMISIIGLKKKFVKNLRKYTDEILEITDIINETSECGGVELHQTKAATKGRRAEGYENMGIWWGGRR